MNQEFSEMGVDKIIIMPGGSQGMLGMTGIGGVKLTDDDLNAIRRVNGVKEAGGLIYGVVGSEFNNKHKYIWLVGVPTDKSRIVVESMQNVEIVQGRDLRKNDKYKALVARELYNGHIFGEPVALGNNLLIRNYTFRVVGLLGAFGNSQDDSSIYVPLDTASSILEKNNSYDLIIAQALSGVGVAKVAGSIEDTLRRNRNLKKGEEDFSVSTMEELIKSYGVILDVVQIVFLGIAAISLVVGGIGIMNTMFTAVLERTKEIGIMKAIGARNRDILTIFLIESGLLGLIGGVLGLLLGVSLSKLIEKATSIALGLDYLKAYFPTYLIIGSLAFSFVVGCVSGVLPAFRASKLKPADALRYE